MIIQNLDTHCVIKWRLTDICNYNCSYCIRKPLRFEKEYDISSCILEIRRIAGELSQNTGKPVKLELIGGEVTLFDDLGDLIRAFPNVDKINITTNFHRPVEWFKTLPLDRVTITASFHQEFTKISDFIEKAKIIAPLCKYFKCETVYWKEAEHIDEFINLCKENNLQYQVEGDLNDPNITFNQCSSTKKNPRYLVDGKYYLTRNSYLKEIGHPYIKTDNILCSRDVDYIYIERDEVWSCHRPWKLWEYHPFAEMHPCTRPSKKCSMCGNISFKSI